MDLSILDNRTETCRAALAGEMDIYTVADLKARLDDLLAGHPEIELDLGGVSVLDSAGLQLLLAARRRAGPALRFINPSPPVLEMLALSNLAGVLGDSPLPASAASARA